MTSVYDAPPKEIIDKVAEKLKSIPEIKPPMWVNYVKTGAHKERPPVEEDWWFIRAASVLRSVHKLGPVGVSKLRTKYGGKKNRGMKPEKFYKGSGNILRKILQQLEKADLLKFVKTGIHKGRVITPKGESLLDHAAMEIIGAKPQEKKLEAKPEVKQEVPSQKAEKTPEQKEAKAKKPDEETPKKNKNG